MSKYCFLRYNSALHTAVKFKIDQLKRSGKSITQIGEESGINRTRISKYYNDSSKNAITQIQLMKLIDYLGIEIDLSIKINERTS